MKLYAIYFDEEPDPDLVFLQFEEGLELVFTITEFQHFLQTLDEWAATQDSVERL